MNRTHMLKTWQEYFGAILSGDKTFEMRFDDRGYRVGDTLWLREWDPLRKEYTGRETWLTVTYVMSGWGLQPDWVVMGIKSTIPQETA